MPYKCRLSPLTTGKLCQRLLMIHNAQLIEHALCLTLQCPVHVPHTICHIGKYGFFFRKCRISAAGTQIPDPVLCDYLPFIWLFQSSKHTQKCCFSGSVDTDHTDLLSFGNATGNVIKNHFSAKNLLICSILIIFIKCRLLVSVFYTIILKQKMHCNKKL